MRAYITQSGRLLSRGIQYVIHTVGPRGSTAGGDQLLKFAYTNSLLQAHEHGLESIAFPAISIGIFGFDPVRAAETSFEAIQDFCRGYPTTSLKVIRLVFWTQPSGKKLLNKMLELFRQCT